MYHRLISGYMFSLARSNSRKVFSPSVCFRASFDPATQECRKLGVGANKSSQRSPLRGLVRRFDCAIFANLLKILGPIQERNLKASVFAFHMAEISSPAFSDILMRVRFAIRSPCPQADIHLVASNLENERGAIFPIITITKPRMNKTRIVDTHFPNCFVTGPAVDCDPSRNANLFLRPQNIKPIILDCYAFIFSRLYKLPIS